MQRNDHSAHSPSPNGTESFFDFEATNVTGTQTLPVRVQRSTPAETVAKSIASDMSLPGDVSWSLRDDLSSVFLRDDLPIGDQLEPGANVTLTPKAHLGATRRERGE